MCKPHLDLLALAPRLLEALGASERPGDVAGVLMDVARDLARWLLRAALRLEWAHIAVELACAIQKRLTALDILRLELPGLPCRDVVRFNLDLAWS